MVESDLTTKQVQEYKETEIGFFPSDWEITDLEKVTSMITDGKHGDCNNDPNSGYYFLSAKDVKDGELKYSSARQITKDDFDEADKRTKLQLCDVLLTNSGTIGRLAIARDQEKTKRTTFQKSVAILRANETILDSQFLYYSLLSNKKRIIETAGGTTQKNLLLKDLRNFQIAKPSLKTQKEISKILTSIDSKIFNLNKRNSLLEKITQTIFKSWFIDFDGQTEFIDSELGDVPKAWEIKSIRKVAEINELNIPKDFPHSKIEYIDISAVSEGKLLEIRKIPLVDAPSRAKRVVRDYDIIWSTVRPNRKSYLLLNKPTPQMIVSTGFAVITPKSVPASFLYSYLTTEEFVNYLISNADGSAYPAVNFDRIAEYKIVVPTHQILQSYDNITKKIFDQIWNNNILSKKISKIRDSLLSKLMSGEIRI